MLKSKQKSHKKFPINSESKLLMGNGQKINEYFCSDWVMHAVIADTGRNAHIGSRIMKFNMLLHLFAFIIRSVNPRTLYAKMNNTLAGLLTSPPFRTAFPTFGIVSGSFNNGDGSKKESYSSGSVRDFHSIPF